MESDFGSWFADLTHRLYKITREARVYTKATALREFCQCIGKPHESDMLIPEQHACFVKGENVGLKYSDFLPHHRQDERPNPN